jgi:hypothetical protein
VKIILYRNYNSSFEDIRVSTPFENTSTCLKNFLLKTKNSGGWGNEALEVFMQEVNKEGVVDQIILIGDAEANAPSEIVTKRSNRG